MYIQYCCLSVTSGCLTFGITLLRTIAIFKPLYHIKPKFPICGLMTMIITFSTLLVVKSLWIRPSDKLGGILIVILSGLNIIMSISAIVALRKRSQPGRHVEGDVRKRATITIIIISAVYSCTSSFLVIVLLRYYDKPLLETVYFFLYHMLIISLSSLLNQLVYLFRKQKIHLYIKNGFANSFRRMMSLCKPN